MSNNHCESVVRVRKVHANPLIQILREKNLMDTRFRISEIDDCILIPSKILPPDVKEIILRYEPEIYEEFSPQIWEKLRARTQKKKATLKDALKHFIPPEYHDILPRSFDMIGKIAIIEVNREDQLPLRPYIQKIGDTLLELHPHVESVFEKAGDIEGTYRTRALLHISGSNNTVTRYKENNTQFFIDVEKTFFSPRLSFERDRVSRIISPYTTKGWVWDMFCGVGPFILQIAQRFPGGKYIGTDINPRAIELANKNLGLLKKPLNVKFNCVDISQILNLERFSFLKSQVSRIIMNLPEKNLEFISCLPHFIHPEGCLLHIYQFNEKLNPLEGAKSKIAEKLDECGLRIEKILSSRVVKPYSPALDTTVLDVLIKIKKPGN